MKLYPTTLDREDCIECFDGYTEIYSTRYCLEDTDECSDPPLQGNHILFSYDYDTNGAETRYTTDMVKQIITLWIVDKFIYASTHAGYVNREGIIIEGNGYLLTFDDLIDPVALGALAHKIANLFRQESVLAIYRGDVTFVYS